MSGMGQQFQAGTRLGETRTINIGGHYFVVEPGDPVATGPTVRIRPLIGRPSLKVITGLNKAQRRQKQIEAILEAASNHPGHIVAIGG